MLFKPKEFSPQIDPGTMVLGLVVVWACLGSVGGILANELAVPAEFIRDIKMPGFGEGILRPTAIHFDSVHQEILVADSGNNRILIFDDQGPFKFSFSLNEIMTTPRDIVTDQEGMIYVLGSDPAGQVLFHFDFDGAPIARIPVPGTFKEIPVELRYMAIDEEGTLFSLDHRGRRILVHDRDGTISRAIDLDREIDLAEARVSQEERVQGNYALGIMTCADGKLYVPVSNAGSVHVYSTAGRFLQSVGAFGAKPGLLNFPVAVEVSPEGLVMVLDRHRYCVVCYTPDGKFLGEFGGKGLSPGWFMGPSLLTVSAPDRAIVGQVFRNKIQVCAVPEFIRIKAGLVVPEQADDAEELSLAPVSARPTDLIVQRRLSETSRPIGSQGGEFPSPNSVQAPERRHISYPEVSE